jgi:CRP/FNR family transcriptional regulator
VDVSEALAQVPALRALPRAKRNELARVASLSTAPRRSVLFRYDEGADVYRFVVGGRVKLVVQQSSGRETILDHVHDGGLVCGNRVTCGGCYCCSAVVDEDATILSIPRRALLEVLEVRSSPALGLLNEVTSRGAMLCGRIGEITAGRVEQRLAMILLRLAGAHGRTEADGSVVVETRLSRQDLADLCGTAVETATRAMTSLERSGVISKHPDGVRIRDLDGLEELV